MNATQALLPSWQRAWQAIGASDAGNLLFQRLLARYAEPHRKYHTLQHLSECLVRLGPALGLAQHPGEVEVALWFHDAVYDLDRHDNEAQSALWARQAARDAGAVQEVADRIHDLVMATQHKAAPVAPDAQLLVDVDLAILGADPQRFDAYEQQIRVEYARVPLEVARPRRLAILRSFLARPSIYSTPYFRGALEEAARDNLQRSIARLTSDL